LSVAEHDLVHIPASIGASRIITPVAVSCGRITSLAGVDPTSVATYVEKEVLAMTSEQLDAQDAMHAANGHHVLARFREYMVGPTRFMNLLSCFELGVVDQLRASPDDDMTARELAAATGTSPHAIDQLLQLLVKEGFVSYDESSRSYMIGALRDLSDEDFDRVTSLLTMIKVVCLRQLYYLTESVRSGSTIGLQELYGFDGTLYEACAQHEDLRTAWGDMMDQVTAFIDPWFFDNVEIEGDTKVLDLAGNTGLGAILTYRLKGAAGLQVTCFDLPEKESEALRNFRRHGVEDNCSFIGGDVFVSVPRGFDVVLIKHFLDMFDRENVFQILRRVHDALDVGGRVYVLVPIYPEDATSSCSVDFFPAYFLGCTMGQGGPQKLSTYRHWLEACGFEVTKAISEDVSTMPPDVLALHGLLCATKAGAAPGS
jgi:hypothetical protein